MSNNIVLLCGPYSRFCLSFHSTRGSADSRHCTVWPQMNVWIFSANQSVKTDLYCTMKYQKWIGGKSFEIQPSVYCCRLTTWIYLLLCLMCCPVTHIHYCPISHSFNFALCQSDGIWHMPKRTNNVSSEVFWVLLILIYFMHVCCLYEHFCATGTCDLVSWWRVTSSSFSTQLFIVHSS